MNRSSRLSGGRRSSSRSTAVVTSTPGTKATATVNVAAANGNSSKKNSTTTTATRTILSTRSTTSSRSVGSRKRSGSNVEAVEQVVPSMTTLAEANSTGSGDNNNNNRKRSYDQVEDMTPTRAVPSSSSKEATVSDAGGRSRETGTTSQLLRPLAFEWPPRAARADTMNEREHTNSDDKDETVVSSNRFELWSMRLPVSISLTEWHEQLVNIPSSQLCTPATSATHPANISAVAWNPCPAVPTNDETTASTTTTTTNDHRPSFLLQPGDPIESASFCILVPLQTQAAANEAAHPSKRKRNGNDNNKHDRGNDDALSVASASSSSSGEADDVVNANAKATNSSRPGRWHPIQHAVDRHFNLVIASEATTAPATNHTMAEATTDHQETIQPRPASQHPNLRRSYETVPQKSGLRRRWTPPGGNGAVGGNAPSAKSEPSRVPTVENANITTTTTLKAMAGRASTLPHPPETNPPAGTHEVNKGVVGVVTADHSKSRTDEPLRQDPAGESKLSTRNDDHHLRFLSRSSILTVPPSSEPIRASHSSGLEDKGITIVSSSSSSAVPSSTPNGADQTLLPMSSGGGPVSQAIVDDTRYDEHPMSKNIEGKLTTRRANKAEKKSRKEEKKKKKEKKEN